MLSFKKVVSSTLAILTLAMPIVNVNIPVSVSADASICDLYTKTVTSTLTLSGSTANCSSTVVGSSGVTTKIVITQSLQKKNSSGSWTNSKTATSNAINSYKGSFSKSYSGLAKGTYRVKTTATVYAGNKSETVTSYSSTKTVR